ncbi:GNAT family N-acetyltransferase [Thermotalea metallivorans]|uniref:Spermidine N(1)-acetyltransferase n=1 Tax=Thermotalea metallivorans TaxID=520762 RepID=A0A140L725_9FIRM|nr:GNAT family protein [Thermotalea metallivorans]KXG76350.1 Spermidine N(1)-acetyltransferase [Thermotalea metallivorans]
MLQTERLILKLLDEEDEQCIVRWRNKINIIRHLFSFKGTTFSEHRRWFEQYIKHQDRMEFIIMIKENGKKIGTIGFNHIDYRNQKAEYGILIGEEEEQGKGYALEASRAFINYGFKELNLQKIYLKVFYDNDEAIKLYKKLNFQQEGVLRKEIYKNGQFKDVVIMSVLKEEWKES